MRSVLLFSGALLATSALSTTAVADPLVPATQLRHGRPVPYLANVSKVAVFGSASTFALRQAVESPSLRVESMVRARDTIVLSIRNENRVALTATELSNIRTHLRTVPGVRGTGPVYFDGPSLHVATGKLWVYLPKGTGRADAESRLHSMGLRLVDYLDAVDVIAVGTPVGSFSIEEVTEQLLGAGHDVVPELMRRCAAHLIPSDDYFAEQWTHRNTGDNVTDAYSHTSIDGIAYADARVSDAWDTTTGDSSTLIAVIDSGTDCDHPELAGKCEQPYNAVDDIDDSEPPPTSEDMMAGHGTSVAGIAAAPMDAQGMVGVCPDCRIVPVRLIESGTFLTDTMMLRGFKHAVDAGAAVINNSWGPALGGEYFVPVSQGELQGIQYAGQGRGGLGVLVVYAAGNENSDTQYLGQLQTGEPNVMAVAASNHLDRRSVYSNFGAFLDISAPTNDSYISPSIISLEIVGEGDLDEDYTSSFGGTSAAAPVVSGVAGLILSVAPDKSAAELRDILVQTADKIDPDGGYYDANGFSVKYGFGRVNAFHAVLAAQGLSDPACDTPQSTDDCSVHLDENCDGYIDEGCATATNLGQVCGEASECGTEGYWECPDTGKVRGMCTYSCTSDPCPAGAVCLLGRCVPECSTELPCPQAETVCTDDVLGVCLRRCTSSAECPDDEICEPQLEYCVLDTDGLPGSRCVSDECVGTQALCLSPGMGFPDGYCTHACTVNANCEDGGKCISTMNGSFCYKACMFDGDCRPDYVCEQAGPRAGTCYKECNKDSQCRGTEAGWEHIVCDLATGRCVEQTEADAGVADAEQAEASVDATGPEPSEEAGVAESDAGQPSLPGSSSGDDDGGCGCRVPATGPKSSAASIALLLAGLFGLRRRYPRT